MLLLLLHQQFRVKELIYMKDRLKREFYAEMCRLERWSVRTLRAKIGGMLYERTVLSGRADAVIDAEIASLRATDQLTPDLISATPTCSTFWACTTGTANATWKTLSSATWSDFCWN